MAGKITTILAKKEAETYCLQGLHKEALQIYRKLLNTSPNIDSAFKAGIENQIEKISEELESDDLKEANRLTASDIIRVKKGWGENATESDMLICAQAFYQIGYFKESLNELAVMLRKGCGTEKVSSLLAECLAKLYRPSQVIEAIEKLNHENDDHPEGRFHLYMVLAEKMVSLDQPRHANAIVTFLTAQPASSDNDARRLAAIAESIGPLEPGPTNTEKQNRPPGAEKPSPADRPAQNDASQPSPPDDSRPKSFFRRFFFFRKNS